MKKDLVNYKVGQIFKLHEKIYIINKTIEEPDERWLPYHNQRIFSVNVHSGEPNHNTNDFLTERSTVLHPKWAKLRGFVWKE